jgi:hypothetical protein
MRYSFALTRKANSNNKQKVIGRRWQKYSFALGKQVDRICDSNKASEHKARIKHKAETQIGNKYPYR